MNPHSIDYAEITMYLLFYFFFCSCSCRDIARKPYFPIGGNEGFWLCYLLVF